MASKIESTKIEPGSTLTVAQFESLKPEDVAGHFVSKETFFALTSLSAMLPAAAQATYDRWVMTGRVKEIAVVVESITGLEDDVREVSIAARYVNAERKRANTNARRVEEMRTAGFDVRPLALRK